MLVVKEKQMCTHTLIPFKFTAHNYINGIEIEKMKVSSFG